MVPDFGIQAPLGAGRCVWVDAAPAAAGAWRWADEELRTPLRHKQMAVVRHLEGFEVGDLETPIWRYIDLAKLQSLVATRALYFASARQFLDKFEGSITKRDYEFHVHSVERIAPDTDLLAFMVGSASQAFQELTRLTKICCWHMNPHESLAMWQLYLRDGCGVAIRSTIRRLAESLGEFRLKPEYQAETVWLGSVRYIDYKAGTIAGDSMLGRFFSKRASYAFEREYRAVISLRLAEEYGCDVPDEGILVPVDVAQFLERIHIAPGMDTALVKRVRDLLRTHGLNTPVTQSDLDDAPLF